MKLYLQYTGELISKNNWHTIAKNRKQIILTGKYRKFKKDLELIFRSQAKKQAFTGPVRIDLIINIKSNKDAQNIEMPVFDALEKAGIIDNDKNIFYHTCFKQVKQKGEQEFVKLAIEEFK